LDVKAKVAEPTDEVSGGATPVGAVEVVGPEVAVVDVVTNHLIRGGEHGGGGLLRW